MTRPLPFNMTTIVRGHLESPEIRAYRAAGHDSLDELMERSEWSEYLSERGGNADATWDRLRATAKEMLDGDMVVSGAAS